MQPQGPGPRDPAEDVEVLEFGGAGRSRPPWPRWLRWTALAAAAATVGLLIAHARQDTPAAAPVTAASPADSAAAPPTPATPGAVPTGPVVSHLPGPLLGVTAGWEVFARGATGVVRIQPASGRVTRTPVPPLSSSGPVSFVVGRDWVVVRPLDRVTGYLVPDGGPARTLAGSLAPSGPAYPGPDGRTVWIPAPDDSGRIRLVGPDGRAAGPSAALPSTMQWSLLPDGTGHLLASGTGGVYRVMPDGLHRVTDGSLLAVGPTRLLVLECDARHRCASIVVDRDNGTRRVLDAAASEPTGSTGLISPDGSMAAVRRVDQVTGASGIDLLDLGTGRHRRVPLPAEGPDDQTMTWSPDSHWLFVIGGEEKLYVVEAADAGVRELVPGLPMVAQVAVRPAG